MASFLPKIFRCFVPSPSKVSMEVGGALPE
uniref:Uncharacterized protein n=1 Tax=Nelumbo nucifera TaxID=4432 RepID=A0A822YCU5_NELNU|nr:TPA_asm: hypothetical protein HUJ06_031411 [Nelumbo nucifera]